MKRKYGGEESEGLPRPRELVVNFREERQGSLARGLTAHQQEPLVQTAARGLLWWRPLQSQYFNRFWEDMEKFGIHPGFGGTECGRRQGGGVSYQARQLLCVRNCQWLAVINQTIRHFHWTRPDCSRWQREAGQVGKKGQEKPLCVARARHLGSELVWARSQPGTEILCPAVFF